MSELSALGESLRRDLEDWIDAQCARCAMDGDLSIGLEAFQSCASDAAALLSAGYQLAALDAWLTAGFRPADRNEFEQQAAAVAASDGGVDSSFVGQPAMHGPAATTQPAPRAGGARADRGGAELAAHMLDAPERSDARTASDSRTAPRAGTSSDARTTPHALLHAPALDAHRASHARDAQLASPAPARVSPTSASASVGARSRTGAGPRAEPRAASGFQRLRGLQDLAARAHTEGELPSDEPTAADPAHARAIHTPSTIERSTGRVMRARAELGAVAHGDPADAGGSVRLDELRARFRPLMEPAAADPSWLLLSVGEGRTRPAQHARQEPVVAADGRTSDADLFAGAASVSELATPSPRARRVHGGEPTLATAGRADDVAPGDIDSILEALDDDLERDFARLYGGG